MPPDDFFDEDWEEPKQTQETAITRPADGAPPRAPDTGERPPRNGARVPRMPRIPRGPRPAREPREGRPPGGPRPPRTSRGGQLEYGRLAILAGGILVVVLVAWWALGRGGGGVSPTEKYFTDVSAVLTHSDAVGKQFEEVLVAPGLKPTQLQHRLQSQVAEAETQLGQAEKIKPTGELVGVHPFLLQALQLRVTGLRCMAAEIVQAAKAKPREGAQQLARCVQRMLASDVVYNDSYASAASDALRAHHIVAQVPTSHFLKQPDTKLVTAPAFVGVLARLGKGAVHGLHGVQLISVVAIPSGKTLTPGGLTTITASQLAFRVAVQDSGHFQEVSVQVTGKLTLNGKTITKTATIPSIQPGKTESVELPAFFVGSDKPQYTSPYTLRVMSGPVPGERKLSNNRGTYRITLVIPS